MAAEYDDSNIQVLEGLEAVRLRPGMYIGSTGAKGLHDLVYEVVDYSIEEALAGHCKNIDISINADGSATIANDGRGIPIEPYSSNGKSILEMVFTYLHVAIEQCNDSPYILTGGFRGVEMRAVINALSARLEVKVWHNLNIYLKSRSSLTLILSPIGCGN
jgi:DNA gyrase subunit B